MEVMKHSDQVNRMDRHHRPLVTKTISLTLVVHICFCFRVIDSFLSSSGWQFPCFNLFIDLEWYDFALLKVALISAFFILETYS